jgi:MFS superfamily sulfate permease-like transporter
MIMVGGILVVTIFRLSDQYGVRIVGAMQTGLPEVSLPKVNLDDVLDLLPGAFAIPCEVIFSSATQRSTTPQLSRTISFGP